MFRHGARQPMLVAGLVSLAAGMPVIGSAQEIAPFRLIGWEGYLTSRYFRDDATNTQTGAGQVSAATTRQTQKDLRDELFIMTHSYVYHPNLLLLDVGAGPILQNASYRTETSETKSKDALYNFTGRATVLRGKPYRGSLFYDHLNPTVSIAPGQVLAQENTTFGFDFSILGPVSPVPFTIDASRSRSQGSGGDLVRDDQIDRLNLRASRSYGEFGTTQLYLHSTRQDSASGSSTLPIQQTTSDARGVNANTRLRFGEDGKYDVFNTVSLDSLSYTMQQGSLADRNDFRFLLDGRTRHSNELRSFASYNQFTSEQGATSTVSRALSGGVNYLPWPNLATSIGGHADSSGVGQFSARSVGLNGSAQYQRPVPFGQLTLGYSFRYDQRDQDTGTKQIDIIGERINLSGVTFVPLSHQRVVSGSIRVSNATRTQVFVEGSDYALQVIGLDTRVQRLVGGAILDGEDVLVDYAYDPGGTFSYTQADQNWNANWNVLGRANVYFRHFDSAPHVTGGTPTSPLNTIRDTVVGLRGDLPLRLGWEIVVGGSVESERREETITPYRRWSDELFIQSEEPFFDLGTIRLTTRHTRQDYLNAAQNVDLTAYDLRWSARPRYGLTLTAEATAETDEGTLNPRRRVAGSLKARWRYRRVTVTLDASHTNETQGVVERTRDVVQLILRRDL